MWSRHCTCTVEHRWFGNSFTVLFQFQIDNINKQFNAKVLVHALQRARTQSLTITTVYMYCIRFGCLSDDNIWGGGGGGGGSHKISLKFPNLQGSSCPPYTSPTSSEEMSRLSCTIYCYLCTVCTVDCPLQYIYLLFTVYTVCTVDCSA